MPTGVQDYVLPFKIRIWHVICCRGCRAAGNQDLDVICRCGCQVCQQRNQDLARNLLPADAGGRPGITCCQQRNQDLARNLLPRMPAERPGLRASKKSDLARNLLPRMPAGVQDYVASKEIKIWHVICCRGCRRSVRDYVLIQRNQDLARNLLPRISAEASELRAAAKK